MTVLPMLPRDRPSRQNAEELLAASQLFFDDMKRATTQQTLATAARIALTASEETRNRTQMEFTEQTAKDMECLYSCLQYISEVAGSLYILNTARDQAAQVRGLIYNHDSDIFNIVIGQAATGPIIWPIEAGNQLFLP